MSEAVTHSQFAKVAMRFSEIVRKLSSELNLERLHFLSLDILARYASSRRGALLMMSPDRKSFYVKALWSEGVQRETEREFVTLDDTPLGTQIETKTVCVFYSDPGLHYLFPGHIIHNNGHSFLSVLLIGRHNSVIGVVLLEAKENQEISDRDLNILSMLASIVAISIENAKLFDRATVDGLTGLYVRKYFDLRLTEELARVRRYGGSMAVLISTIDQFEEISQARGNGFGDKLLKEIGRVFRGEIKRRVDVTCRYGDKYFAAILANVNQSGALIVSERLRDRVSKHLIPGLNDLKKSLSISSGLTIVSEPELVEREIIQRADEMLFKAQSSGRGQIEIWNA